MKHIMTGLCAASLALILDQISKYWILYIFDLPLYQLYEVTPFFDLVMAWNKGISYGLFQQDSEMGRWALIAVKIIAVVLLSLWLVKSKTLLIAASLGLIIGGAVGNGIDRAVHGAVVDFISLHAFGWRWYIFNIADMAIVAGVAGLLYDNIKAKPATRLP